MGSGINLYLASEFEYRRGLAHRLLDEGVIDFCLTDYLPWTEAPTYDERIVPVDHTPSGNDEYSKICDINELPAVSKELMERMLPYESMAIHIGMRRFNYPTIEYEEEKRKYLQHLRYWNYMFEKYRINLIVTHCIPHSQGKYVVYGLARVKGIPMLIWHRSGLIDTRCFWGASLETIGMSIGERYKKIGTSLTDVRLDPDIELAYMKAGNKPTVVDKKHYDSKILKSHKDIFYGGYKDKKKMYLYRKIRELIRSLYKTHSLDLYREKDVWFRLWRRHIRSTEYFMRHQCYSVKEYDKMACQPNYTDRFIIFFLQVSPEASTMPLAGVFAEQYNSIQLLARVAEKMGMLVYVKEHPHIVYRSKDFYAEIKSIKNVKLISSEVISYDLINHCVCVATQTGTCILEAMCQGKPTIVFGDGYFWKQAPGVYEMTDEAQGEKLLKMIIGGIKIYPIDVKRYFYAIQLESLKAEDPSELEKRMLDDNYIIKGFSLDDRVELIKRFISEFNVKDSFVKTEIV